MNLKISQKELRLRVSAEEAATLIASGSVEEQIELPGNRRLVLRAERGPAQSELQVAWEQDCCQWILSSEIASALATPSNPSGLVSIENQSQDLKFYFEVDRFSIRGGVKQRMKKEK